MLTNDPSSVDQASGLREMATAKPIQAIAVTAGKGGVGKTNVSVNLAIALAKQNKKVLLLDGDLGLANIDILLGLHAKKNLSHVVSGECDIQDILLDGPANIKIVPASSGAEVMTNLNKQEHAGLINAFSELSNNLDVLIVDTAAGISETVMSFARATQEVIVVVCDEPTSITDAYALIKVMSKDYGVNRFHVLANMTNSPEEGKRLFMKLCRVTDKFLDVNLDFMGAIPFDEFLKKSVQRQKAVAEAFPSAKSSKEFAKISKKIIDWPLPKELSGSVSFFIERLVQCDQAQ